MWLKVFTFIYFSVYTYVGTEHMLRSENSFWELVLSLHVLTQLQAWVLGLGGRYLLSHLTGLWSCLKMLGFLVCF